MLIGAGCNLWLVGNGNELVGMGQLFHQHAYLLGGFTTDTAVNLVKYQGGHLQRSCHQGLEYQHQPAQFSTTGHFVQRFMMAALVGIKKK